MKRDTFYVGKPIARIDALDKAQGRTKYMSDLVFANMLWGRVLRAKYPHARILGIDTSDAEAMPGVVCVLTHKDVKGTNRFGIAVQDQPVLCEDRVGYVGDAVALVAAESERIAEEALSAIRVSYEPLPVVDSPECALEPDAPMLHKDGNLLLQNELCKGDIKKGLDESDIIVEQTYITQPQEHAFLETEGGIGLYDEAEGIITVYCGAQYAFRDRVQIARAIEWDEEKIRVVASPVGGAFGAKDEITIQIYLALLAYHTKRPVKIVLSREESTQTHVKRHPMKLHFKLGATTDGKLRALDVDILSDTGAYASLGGPVLNVALECAPGPYVIPHTHLFGRQVYTNSGFNGAFRGFGGPQAAFALETNLDVLAGKLGIDPIDLRLANVLHRHDLSGIDHEIFTSIGIEETLKIARSSELWQTRKERKRDFSPPEYYGVGVASAMQPLGLGKGIPDYANSAIELTPEGKFLVRQGAIEIGQGNLECFVQMAAECLQCSPSLIELTHGDTGAGPDSGSVTASKSIYLVGNAIYRAAKDLVAKLGAFVSEEFAQPYKYKGGEFSSNGKVLTLEEVAQKLMEKNLKLVGEGFFAHPVSDRDYGDGLPHCLYAFITQVASVVVDAETGEVRVGEILSIPDCGRAVNPQGVEGQCEGGLAQGIGYALYEDCIIEKGEFLTKNFSTYIIPTALDVPRRTPTVIVESFEDTHPFGAKGMAEPPMVAAGPAVLNAIYDAVGVRIFDLPATPEKILTALKKKLGK